MLSHDILAGRSRCRMPVFGKDHARTKETGRGDDPKRSHHALAGDALAFQRRKAEEASASACRVALRLLYGIDPEEVEQLHPEGLRNLRLRMSRQLARERLKGVRGHWSYDLNRHIALKQALDHVTARLAARTRPE